MASRSDRSAQSACAAYASRRGPSSPGRNPAPERRCARPADRYGVGTSATKTVLTRAVLHGAVAWRGGRRERAFATLRLRQSRWGLPRNSAALSAAARLVVLPHAADEYGPTLPIAQPRRAWPAVGRHASSAPRVGGIPEQASGIPRPYARLRVKHRLAVTSVLAPHCPRWKACSESLDRNLRRRERGFVGSHRLSPTSVTVRQQAICCELWQLDRLVAIFEPEAAADPTEQLQASR